MKNRVVMCPADRPAYVTHIENRLENLQKIVGGRIQAITLSENAALICNEEGRLMGLPANPNVPDVVGDCFIVGVEGEEFTDLDVDSKALYLRAAKSCWAKRQQGEIEVTSNAD